MFAEDFMFESWQDGHEYYKYDGAANYFKPMITLAFLSRLHPWLTPQYPGSSISDLPRCGYITVYLESFETKFFCFKAVLNLFPLMFTISAYIKEFGQ